MKFKIDIKSIVFFFASIFFFWVIGILIGVDMLFCTVITLWANIVYYAISNISERTVLLGFLITFSLFLLSRDFFQNYFGYNVENFDSDVNRHAYILYLIALITLVIAYHIFNRKEKKEDFQIYIDSPQIKYVEQTSRALFLLMIGFAIAAKFIVIRFVSNYSYYEYYTDYSSYASTNIYITILNLIDRMMPVALSAFLSCFPTKKRARFPIILYGIYLMISLGTQARSTAMLGLLFLFIYFLFRQSMNPCEGWINKQIVILIIIMTPVLIMLGSFINDMREGGNSGTKVIELFVDFFYDQGVTSNVVKRAFMYRDRFDQDVLYTLEFLRSGIFARLFGFKVYYGNSIEHALYGGSFAHSIGYAVLGIKYLAGQGTGTSYLAEFFQDFGYIGVSFGTCIYAFIISRISNVKKINKNVWIRTVQLYLIQRILWAPRGSFADIFSTVFSVQVIVMLIVIWGISNLLYTRAMRR